MHRRQTALVFVLLLSILCVGCIAPKDRRPGLRLPGEIAPTPADWSFTDAHPEIAVEVRTPYFLPHSVTIICGSIDGDLYIGARNPESKNWPGWVDTDPEVRLGIGEHVYEAKLVPVTDPERIERIKSSIATKYGRSASSSLDAPIDVRFWQVEPRS